MRLVNLGSIALFSNYKFTTSSGKHLEDNNHAHIVSLIYKLTTSEKNDDDLSIGFDRSRDRRNQELTKNKKLKGKYHVRNYLKAFFDFAEHQEKATYGLGYKLNLTRNSDNSALNKSNGTTIGKIKIIAFQWYVPHYTLSIPQQAKLSNQILNKTPKKNKICREICFFERSKHSNLLDLWIKHLGMKKHSYMDYYRVSTKR